MSSITSRLSDRQKKKLCSLLNHANLCLLFKASVHGYTAPAFHQKCNRQGPTVVVAYNNTGYVFGAYTSKDYAQTSYIIVDEKAFLFSFNDKSIKEDPLRVFSGNPQFAFTDTGPNFGSLVFLYNNTATVYSNPGPGQYQFDPKQMHGNNLQLVEFEVYRVEECGGLMEKPWRNIQWNTERRKGLLSTISEWKPSVKSVKQARILLVGPVGAGKSSFFNSINSVFKGYVSTQANTGTAGSSLTTQFRTYSIKPSSGLSHIPFTLCDTMGLEEGLNAGLHVDDFYNNLKGHVPDRIQFGTYRIKAGKTGHILPFMLCDTMGMEEVANAGLDVDDFTNILKGHIRDRYQFNPSVPLQDDSPHFHKSASFKDKIHCVLYVMDTSKVKLLSKEMIEKFVALRRKANQLGIPQLVLLTKVDEACPLVAADLKLVYQSCYINRIMHEVCANIGVSLTAVVPVKNYSKEVELDPEMDVLLLNALNHILRAADGYFDDQGEHAVSA